MRKEWGKQMREKRVEEGRGKERKRKNESNRRYQRENNLVKVR